MSATTAEPWKPGRGDYGTEYAGDLIEIIEEHNCSKGRGCVHGGSRRVRRELGQGGSCPVLLAVFLADPVPDLDPKPSGPVCRKYQERPEPKHQRKKRGTEPLFEVNDA